MGKKLIILLKIYWYKLKIWSIDDDIWTYYLNLNFKNLKFHSGRLDIEKEFELFKRINSIERNSLQKKLSELKSKLHSI
jgi:hypothetical protein